MILIPEIQTVVIMVPRTGTGSIKKAVAARYPNAMFLYRHMEADGVPAGYDRWQKVGVLRNPVDRLKSLYKFLKNFDGHYNRAYIDSMRRSVNRSFSDWVLNNQTVFTSPYDSEGLGRFWPYYNVNHCLPENAKSQFIYLRPDLGTKIFKFKDIQLLGKQLDIDLPYCNGTNPHEICEVSNKALDYIYKVFQWDNDWEYPK